MFMERTLGDIEPVIDRLTDLLPLEGSVESPRSTNKLRMLCTIALTMVL